MNFVVECGSEVVSVSSLDEVVSSIEKCMSLEWVDDEGIVVTSGGEPLSFDQLSYIKSKIHPPS